ncbi:Pyridine nucleotide-disulfide oxidoreductase domain-containing protein 2 [Quaeritorhiza haematococci]|nr:Pyridine nucleotide-disulfide oxidoreductase domain-containing protein 2 [Quaeritorhiza haematococci]
MGPGNMPAFYELLTAPASKILTRWFESEPLRSTLATDAVIGAMMSPNTPGSGYVLLHHVMGKLNGVRGAWGIVEGGMGAVSKAIESVAVSRGVEIRTNAPVRQILLDTRPKSGSKGTDIDNGPEYKAVGVELETGEKIYGRCILSNATPKITFLDLLPQDSGSLPPTFETAVKGISYASATTKINVALSALPNFTCLPNNPSRPNDPLPHHQTTIHMGCASLDELDEAFKDADTKGVPSRIPLIEMTIPSSVDRTLVDTPGHHVATLFVQWTPYEYFATSDPVLNDQRKREFAERVFDTITQYAPNFKSSIVHADILTPPDLEREFSLTGGNIFHGAMSLDQLYWTRPVNAGGGGGYRTPVEGLYLCGSGAHPGGGVMGAPGRNAAKVVLDDLM